MFIKRCTGALLLLFLIVFVVSCSIIPGSKNSVSPLWTNTMGDDVEWISVNYNGSYVAIAADSAYLFDGNGNRVWAQDVNPEVIAIDSLGSYIATACDADVYMFNRNGDLLWHNMGDPIDEGIDAISMSNDGNYVALGSYNLDHNGKIYLYKKDGTRIIDYTTTTAYADGVAISGDGSYVAAGSGGKALLFDNSGSLLWSIEVDSAAQDTIFAVGISDNGSAIAFGSTDGYLYFFNLAGEFQWKFRTEGTINRIRISRNGKYVAVGSLYDDNLYFLKSDGTLLWKKNVDNWIRYIGMDYECNYITVGTDANDMFVFKRDGTLLWKYTGIGSWGGTPVSGDGKFVVSGSNYNVSLFKI